MLAISTVTTLNQPEKDGHPFLTGCCDGSCWSTVELCISIVCSFVSTQYMLNSESTGNIASFASVHTHLHPSAGVMFGSCLVLGCSVSSFLYRHVQDDPYQASLFVLNVIGAMAVGELAGSSFNMILLGYIPWAVCIAMFCILCGHALMRWMEIRVVLAGRGADANTTLLLLP